MSDMFIGEIRAFGFNFPPRGWAMCNGQLLSIAQNTALFSILGTMYGGDGKSTFALPDLQGNLGMGWGSAPGLSPHDIGETGGSITETLAVTQLPLHSHTANGHAGAGNHADPAGSFWAQDLGGSKEYSDAGTVQMAHGALGVTGSGFPHNNLQPCLVLNYCIALQGIYPPRS